MYSNLLILLLAGVCGILAWYCTQVLPRRNDVLQDQIDQLKHDLDQARKQDAEDTLLVDAVLRASDDSILVVDHHGVCKIANLSASKLFERTDNCLDSNILSLSQSAELDTLFKQAVLDLPSAEQYQTCVGEVVLWAFHAAMIQVVISRIVPAKDPDDVSYFIIVLRDVTELRRLTTMRRDFVANVSHELRTPLSSVQVTAETLLDGALEDEQMARHFLNTIVREAGRLVRLADDLLELSRIESMPLQRSQCDLASLMEDVAARFGSQVSKADLTIRMNIGRPLFAECDADEMSQVFLNLFDNAIKYTPNGGQVDIRAIRMDGWVVVEIEDTGIGILSQDIPRVFERFYRTDKARSRQSGGTGLGLAIVKHIVERHDGEIWVRSEYNHGSVFGFAIPESNSVLDRPIRGFDSAFAPGEIKVSKEALVA